MNNLPCCCIRNESHIPLDDAYNATETIRTGKAVNYINKVWEQDVVTYAYLSRDRNKEDIVEAWVDWINTNLGIRLTKIDDPNKSDMRFDFKPEDGGRSYYGNDALKIADKTHWTTNFGFIEFDPILKEITPDADLWKIERIVSHELPGHALCGMLHTQMHSQVVYSPYDREWRIAQGYSIEEIEAHYSLKAAITKGIRTDIQMQENADPESGMLYPIEVKRLAEESKIFGYYPKDYPIINYAFSDGDKRLAKLTYPKVNTERIAHIPESEWKKFSARQTTEFDKVFELFAE